MEIEKTRKKGLFIRTPLLSRKYDDYLEVFFKLDSLQPSGSFKDRGIGHMISSLTEQGNVDLLITSSGGNAGHAVACIGRKLMIPVCVYVPITTKPMMINIIKKTGAQVIVRGENWNEADSLARAEVEKNANARYIPPFDDPLIWQGHSSLVDELVLDFGIENPPDEILVSVGGGGLLAGIQLGLHRVGWISTRVKAVETSGAASFAAAKAAGQVVSLPKISTVATTLGALAVTPIVLESDITTDSVVVSDEEAVTASYYFANDYRILVEPACGASLSLVLLKKLRDKYYVDQKTKTVRVVVIVCGGSAVSLELMNEWKDRYVIPYENSE